MTLLAIGVLVALAVNILAVVTAIVCIVVARRRGHALSAAAELPGVSVLKPLCGHDDELEANLESFAALDYPRLQIIFSAADPSDPALEIARRVARRHPERNIQVRFGDHALGWNLKVNQLEAMLGLAEYDLLWISDSNVRTSIADLAMLVAALTRDPAAGMAFQPLVGRGERTIAAAFENLRLTEYCGAMCITLKALLRLDAVTGKSLLVRRGALIRAGGFAPLRDIAGDDQALAMNLRRDGWKVVLVPRPAHCIHVGWSFRELISRHVRHAAIRRHMSAWSYPFEGASSPVVLATIETCLGRPLGPPLLAGAIVAKVLLEAAASLGLRDRAMPLRYLLLVPARDFLMLGIWFVPWVSSRVSWRGSQLRMRSGSRLCGVAERAPPAGDAAVADSSPTSGT